MKRLNHFPRMCIVAGLVAVALLTPGAVLPESDTCPQLVQQALDATNDVCQSAGRNQACYGHIQLEAQPQPFVNAFDFSDEGDTVAVEQIRSLRLGAMDLDAAAWGIALMRLRAGLPQNEPDQNVTLLLFGDVELEHVTDDTPTADVTVASTGRVNVRQRPDAGAFALGTAGPADTLLATGRLMVEDEEWVRVELPDTGNTGWIAAFLINETDAIATLDVVEPASRRYGPMQAFYFHSGADDALCPEAPNSGLVIQTPEGEAKVTFLINEVAVQLGSTVYFQAQPGESMTISVIEGSAVTRAGGVISVAQAGMQITVPVDADMVASGPPTPPAAYEIDNVAALPVGLLPREVEVAPPAEPDVIEELLEATAEEEDAVAEEEGTPEDGELPSGLIDNPGLGDNLPPGHGGEPPGQTKKDED